ncbi:MAG: ABC transporter ATP-binding protein [Ilumatobacteraceae bacterium]
MTALIEARHLSRSFRVSRRSAVHAVSNLDLAVGAGQRLGLIGASGSGKTTLAKLLLGLDEPTSGEVLYRGTSLSATDMPAFRREIQMVFQDPRSSLDPMMKVADIVREPLECLGMDGHDEGRVREVLHLVGLDDDIATRRPHQLSGGQRQRVAIARALATKPRLLIADEPVSALDALVRDEILSLFESLTARLGLGLLLISHDLSVIARLCTDVAVMQHGEIVERGPVSEVFGHPRHAYTEALLAAVPRFG